MKKATIPEEIVALNARQHKAQFTNTDAQVTRVLHYLLTQQGDLNRYQAERELNVCHLAPRIKTLRNRGYSIATVPEQAEDPYGQWHDGIARYVLTAMPEAANDACGFDEVAV